MQEFIKRLSTKVRDSVLCTGGLLYLLHSPLSFTSNEQLSNIKNNISHQEQQLNTLQTHLKKQEQSISSFATKIHNTSATLKLLETDIVSLNRESQHLKQLRLGQIKLLKKLLNNQYRQGKHSQLNTFLSEENSSVIDRMTVYAKYLSKARTHAINTLSTTDTELELKYHMLAEQTRKQTVLLSVLTSVQTKLKKEQGTQQKTVNAIQYQIRSNKGYLSELRNNESRFKIELEEATKKTHISVGKAHIKMEGLGKYKGHLSSPVKGKVLHSFGSVQTGKLLWSGIVISAKKGAEVNAAHDGTVVLSNWLRGYGLMVVIDHGKGDMSSYGYNQALLKKVGDTVKAGDAIALVGNSGGQTNTGLYFEIRRKGNATNPSPWLVR
ncbi:peptidoglycan DD-metalloendopeptidase family protein [Candidatus Enterovibrio escicola]|uniref:peptidoglycan DD-metalloendopeptidase family protein n=1 Tax=Candidatus Enterovibrio escicola TaxID=1927127 RepID=UPI001237B293|nr:peptidoglycan DD-metalloendopeptidase family protein [Candidatus Enterovibrio escacola]